MAACTLSSACGCIELRTSSFIIAYINLVLSIIFSTVMLLGIAGGAVVANISDKEEERRMAKVLMVLFVIRLLHFLRMIVFTVVLLVGLHKIKRNLVKVYLITAAIFFLLDFIMFFVGFVHGYSAGTVVLRFTLLSPEAYSFLVVRSYYYEMGTNKSVMYTTAYHIHFIRMYYLSL